MSQNFYTEDKMDLKDLKSFDKNDILNALGLEAKRDVLDYLLPFAGLFGAGLLVGVGVGMLVAPKPGRELREDLGRQMGNVRERAMNVTSEVSAH